VGPRDRPGSLIYEVFRQEKKGVAFAHAGSVDAPDAEFARAFAHEQYGRRQESVALWVVQRDAIDEVTEFFDELGKTYHRVDGYSLKAKLKEARDRAGTAHE
jgi:ring-1,2-phenylacetyl-CoA epoxidase subunit PaaB